MSLDLTRNDFFYPRMIFLSENDFFYLRMILSLSLTNSFQSVLWIPFKRRRVLQDLNVLSVHGQEVSLLVTEFVFVTVSVTVIFTVIVTVFV